MKRKTVLSLLLAAVGLWLLWPVLLPFLAAWVLARVVEPVVRRLPGPRWLRAAVCMAGAQVLLFGGCFLLGRSLLRQLWRFCGSLPEMAGALAAPMSRLKERLLLAASRFPDGIGAALEQGVTDFFRGGAGLGQRLYDWAFAAVSALLTRLPELGVFLLTAVLAGFFLSARLPELEALWREKAPEPLPHLGRVWKSTLGVWLAAQGKLLAITFLLLTAGFLILRVDYALLFGLGIALLDALPAVGTGLLLIPWSLLRFLQGDTVQGVGLLLLYGITALTRASLEPRLLGRQVGLDPLVTLLALYTGYRIGGVGGMILLPLAALMGKQLWDGRHGTA